MKKILTLLFIVTLCTSVVAQINIDSVLTGEKISEGSDSVSISQLVEMQVLAARLKAIEESELTNEDKLIAEEIKIEDRKEVKAEESQGAASAGFWVVILSLINGIPVEYKILVGASFILFFLIFFRRINYRIQKSVKVELKKKIGMMREERVFVKTDGSKSELRKTLVESNAVNKLSEKNIGKTAKELRVSKGELLLAARIKYLEYGKM